MEIFENLDWLVYGILIGLFVPAILIVGNKQLGISSSLQNMCMVIIPKTIRTFNKNESIKNQWKLYFVIGIAIGGFLASNIFAAEVKQLLPQHYYSLEGIVTLLFGGFLVGFGTRYANGCTSGHSITGLSLLQLSSLIATISFFVGGLLTTFLNSL